MRSDSAVLQCIDAEEWVRCGIDMHYDTVKQSDKDNMSISKLRLGLSNLHIGM